MKLTGMRMPAGIGTKIMFVAVCPVVVGLAVTMITLVLQQRQLERQINATIRQQAFNEAAKVAESVYLLCVGFEQRNQRQLAENLALAGDRLAAGGGASLSSETVAWKALNQFTGQRTDVTLPKLQLGGEWLGQVGALDQPAKFVDDVRRQTGNFCTIFQRMNEAGDMVRVATNVPTADGRRAIGTFLPALNPGGATNAAIKAVLAGQSFRGRAFEVNEWYSAGFAPLWDTGKKRVIGMISVGAPFGAMNRETREVIAKMTVGKTGYVYVLGGQDEERGRYLLSYKGKRDGENIWDARDASGRLFIQSIINKAVAAQDGHVEFETYPWQNSGETVPRMKFVALTQFAAWNWVIGASGYEDEFATVGAQVEKAQQRMLVWVAVAAGVVASLAALAGLLFARGIAGPITRVIVGVSESSVQINGAANQTARASHALADGSSRQAASLEEISASLEEMSGMTKRNAENAGKANELTRAARSAADAGTGDMHAMSGAMRDIKTSSDDIAKIIKTIDEIAFQTNILALNAAVEAARAGESGMGFAVVAEEVRSLAQRSAQAARETAEKIEGAIGKTEQGVRISEKVELSLAEIVEKVRHVDTLVAEVAVASREQSQGVEQINQGVREMDKVVQTNAAAAEESASASADMSHQAAKLNEAVAELQALVGARGDAAMIASADDPAPTSEESLVASAPTRHRADAKLVVR